VASGGWSTWRAATERALYGDGGFYRRTDAAPAAHFRTSVHASPLFAGAVLALARSAGLRTVVDVGSGGGELLAALHELDPTLRLIGVEVAARPAGLPGPVDWLPDPPAGIEALLVANEWLDNVAVDVVEVTEDGSRLVEVDGHGDERYGDRPTARDLGWLAEWWPLGEPGDRAEVGHPRDDAWAAAVRCLRRGLAVAVDYAHRRDSRPRRGTLTGYRDGRQVPPVPDGSCDITSHVALDSCAAAGTAAGATGTVLTTQREALRALGVRGARPSYEQARADPSSYVAALASAGQAAELTDPSGLGGFGWLVQAVGMPVPRELAGQPRTGTET
jgi:SAM-dependent MidA family methyltransferase